MQIKIMVFNYKATTSATVLLVGLGIIIIILLIIIGIITR
jgi:hypothetical protein